MPVLVTKITTVKRCLKVTFINSTSRMPDFESVQDAYIKPLLGTTIINALGNINEDTPTQFLALVQRAIVPLGYMQDLSLLQVNISDLGVDITTSDNRAAVPRWAYEKLQETLADKASNALEALLTFLHEEKPEDVNWTIPVNKDFVFINGKQFNEYYSIHQPYRTFEQLRPSVMQAEIVVGNTIGTLFFKALKAKAAADLENEEKEVLHLIKCAVAQLTIKHAIGVLPVKITPNGFTASLRDNRDKANQGDNAASDNLMSVLLKTVTANADYYLNQLKNYLDKNSTSELMASYYNSSYYVAPAVKEIVKDKNENSPTFFL